MRMFAAAVAMMVWLTAAAAAGAAMPWLDAFNEAAGRDDCSGMLAARARGERGHDPVAATMQGLRLISGRCGKANPGAASAKFKSAGERGDWRGMFYYAVTLNHGMGTDRNPAAAQALGRQALCRGMSEHRGRWDAAEEVAGLEEDNDTVAFLQDEYRRLRDATRTRDGELKEAADAEGRTSPPPDPQCACHWRWAAARQGSVAGMRDLGLQLIEGRGVVQNTERGWSWLVQAARLGDTPALIAGAQLIQTGRYSLTLQDAYMWLLLAERQGADVTERLTRLRSTMLPIQVRQAVDRLKDGPFYPPGHSDPDQRECTLYSNPNRPH